MTDSTLDTIDRWLVRFNCITIPMLIAGSFYYWPRPTWFVLRLLLAVLTSQNHQ